MDKSEQVMEVVKATITNAGRFTDLSDIDETTDLIAEGYVDSLSMMTLLLELEKLYDCRIPPNMITAENTSSVNNIANMLDRL